MFRKVRKILVCAALVMAVWIAYLSVEIWRFGHRDSAAKSDCVIVLGAAVDDADPSPVYEERIQHAVSLYQRGEAGKIIFTGGYGEGAKHAESEVGAQRAISLGVPAADVFTETHSHTTQENLTEAANVMDSLGLRSAIIVSDPLHLKRASKMARDLELEVVTSPTPTSRYRSWRTRVGFLARELYFYHHYLASGD